MIGELAALLADELPAAMALRHRLHADPRRSGEEDDTADAVCAAVPLVSGECDNSQTRRSRAPTVQRVAGTGRLLRLGQPTGPAVALRAELDGLPIAERTGLSYSSTVPGVMHACGHDLHLAAVVAVARALRAMPALPVGVLVLLQPREEAAPTGAGDVLADPIFASHDVRAVIGAHVQPALPRGVVSIRPGAVNASCDELLITIRGRGGHAAYPHQTDDPVLALAQTVVALHHVVSRRVDPIKAAVLTIGRLDAGTTSNVIPPEARAHGTLRALDPTDRHRLRAAVAEVVAHTAASYGCVGSCEVLESEPVLFNDARLVSTALPALTRLGLRPDAEFRSCGSDDFAHYGEVLPALMLFVGVGTDEPDAPGLHDPRFAPPDDVIADLARAYLAGLSAGLTEQPASTRSVTSE